jgi:protein SCO1
MTLPSGQFRPAASRARPGLAVALALLTALAARAQDAATTAPATAPSITEPPAAAAPAPALKDRAEALPPELRGVGVDEHLNAELPLDLEFTDHTGAKVKLGQYFDGRRPVILTMNYYRCPMLCGLQLNSLLDTLHQLDWVAGEQFQIVTVSFDPLETHQVAALKRQNYLQQYGRPAAANGWQFLTGRKASIDKLLDTTGFRVRWNEETREWMHVAALVICTPDGHISRYLVDIVYQPRTLRLSLVEASEGKIGSALDHVLLFCYHYDGQGGYALAAMNLVRAGGVLTLVFVGTLLAVLWRRERRRPAPVPTP